MIKVSVIIPVYNMEKYLEECLDSICHQTLKDIEIICINDGSKDKSEQILKDYTQKDKRIVLIEQKNQGLSIARNNGIKIAKGQYIGFVDSDDKIDPDFYEKLYNAASKNDADIAISGYKKITKKNKIKTLFKVQKEKSVSGLTQKMNFSENGFYVWNKIYKRDLILENKLFFPENVNFEDISWTLNVLFLAKKIQTVSHTFYYYRYNAQSITKASFSDEKKFADYKKAYKFRDDFIKKYNLKLTMSLRSRKRISIFGINLAEIKNYGNLWELDVLGLPLIKIRSTNFNYDN